MTETRGTPRGRRWRAIAWSAALSVWLLPLLAMQLTEEVDWTVLDFAVFGAMLLSAGGLLELAVRVTDDRTYRAAVAIAVVNAFLLLWVNGAVGIIGSEDNPANLSFIGVLAIAAVGALSTRCRPRGMALTMIMAAGAQALLPAIAMAAAPHPSASLPQVILMTAFFCALWLVAAVLFRTAAPQAT